MAQLIVRNLDDGVKTKLQQRARKHGRSTEEEVRDILRNVVREEEKALSQPLGTRLKSRFSRVGLDAVIVELRGQRARPADLPS
jgi:plasmid stability protein